MIHAQGISLLFGDRLILDDINFSLSRKEKVGLTGRNGAGKTTLLKLIQGDLSPDDGNIQFPGDYEVGFLSQHLEKMEDIPVVEEVSKALPNLIEIEGKIKNVNIELQERTDYSNESYINLAEELSDLNHKYDLLGGAKAQSRIKTILKGLGFSDSQLRKRVSTFSGGWKMRISLAKILLKDPDILLLDEPTNHLDLNSILWLENWLNNTHAISIIISHDVQFLDNVTMRTLELEKGKIYDYPVSFTKYKDLRAERREKLRAAYVNQQKKISEKKRTIERFRAKATKANMAKSMEKQLGKMELIELDEQDNSAINLQFQEAPRSGRIVAELSGVYKSFGKNKVLNDVNLKIERGEKMGFVGQNGQGKTTLAKIILEELQADTGDVNLGHNVTVGYFAQDQAAKLDLSKTVLETLEAQAPREWFPKVRSLLGSFLFSGEDVEKKVSVLSGGEKTRLSIAALLMHPYNFLVLDEPTNHLDVQSKEILKQALRKFDGSLLIVSHDRDFLDDLIDRTVEFRDHQIFNHLSGINEFLRKRKTADMRDIEFSSRNKNVISTNSVSKKERHRLRKDIQRKIQYLERDIDKYENEVSRIEAEMNAPDFFKRKEVHELTQRHNDLKIKISGSTNKWEALVEELESLEN